MSLVWPTVINLRLSLAPTICELWTIFIHSVLIWLDYFSVMIQSNNHM